MVRSRTPRLLVVDDEPGIRLTMGLIFQREGFQVSTVGSVPEALEHIQSESFDVLISDLNIGAEGDGFEVVAAMKQAQPKCVNFILTGYPAFESAVRAIREGVADYFVKPADVALMLKAVRDKLTGSLS